jgi:hypothetical protein
MYHFKKQMSNVENNDPPSAPLDKKTKIRYNRNIKYLKDSDGLKSYFIYTRW